LEKSPYKIQNDHLIRQPEAVNGMMERLRGLFQRAPALVKREEVPLGEVLVIS
jgi:hypothetical protein